jgi:hypothetical protein
MLEQHSQDLKGLLVKFDPDALLPQLTGTQVRFEYVETSPFGGGGGCHD